MKRTPVDQSHTLLMACAVVLEELLPHIPEGMHYQELDFGLHVNPHKLRVTLQDAIDDVSGKYDTIILGYGMCSQAIVGLHANNCRLVVPGVDDCIAIFLGSRQAYNAQTRSEPGTYYLTKGWIEAGITPFSEYNYTAEKYGKKKADRIYNVMMANYRRLALINTGQYEIEEFRDYTKRTANRFNLCFDEIEGSDALVKKMLFGPWDEEFVVLQPGETFTLDQFLPGLKGED